MADETTAELYSKNRLSNPGAETGDTTGWAVSGVTVVNGGVGEDSTKCFKLEATASMYQQKSTPTQPPDFKVGVDFLPETEQADNDTKVYAYLKVEYAYAGGTTDTFVVPCRADGILAAGV